MSPVVARPRRRRCRAERIGDDRQPGVLPVAAEDVLDAAQHVARQREPRDPALGPSTPFKGVSGAGDDSSVPADSRMRPTSRVRASATPGRSISRTSLAKAARAARTRDRRARPRFAAAPGRAPPGARDFSRGAGSRDRPARPEQDLDQTRGADALRRAGDAPSAARWCARPCRSENSGELPRRAIARAAARDQTRRDRIARARPRRAASSISTTWTCLLGRKRGSGDQASTSAASGRLVGLSRSSRCTSAARATARTTSRRSRGPSRNTSAPPCSKEPSSTVAYEVACSSRSGPPPPVSPELLNRRARGRAPTDVR